MSLHFSKSIYNKALVEAKLNTKVDNNENKKRRKATGVEREFSNFTVEEINKLVDEIKACSPKGDEISKVATPAQLETANSTCRITFLVFQTIMYLANENYDVTEMLTKPDGQPIQEMRHMVKIMKILSNFLVT